MPTFDVWDIVKVPFPYADRPVRQRRPPLVIAAGELEATHGLLWLAMVTSAGNGKGPGSIRLVLVGKKGRDYFRRRKYPVLAVYTPVPAEASLEFAKQLTQELIGRFVSGEVDRVELMFTRFISALRRRVVTETFLPVGAERAEGHPSPAGAIFEPDAESIFAELLPRYATAKLFASLADALASEHSARMIAMGSARKNAGELMDLLVLRRNRLRQAAITKELLDIVGGAEALK